MRTLMYVVKDNAGNTYETTSYAKACEGTVIETKMVKREDPEDMAAVKEQIDFWQKVREKRA